MVSVPNFDAFNEEEKNFFALFNLPIKGEQAIYNLLKT